MLIPSGLLIDKFGNSGMSLDLLTDLFAGQANLQ